MSREVPSETGSEGQSCRTACGRARPKPGAAPRTQRTERVLRSRAFCCVEGKPRAPQDKELGARESWVLVVMRALMGNNQQERGAE